MCEKRKLVDLPGDAASAGLNWPPLGTSNKLVRPDFSQSWLKSCSGLFSAAAGLAPPVVPQPAVVAPPTPAPQPSANKMVVCFICGNSTCEENTVPVWSRQPPGEKPDAPFFPFMEYHDPAPGAEPMQSDWSVVSCFVCNAFLVQQWDSFERYKTAISKRLYWLKRPTGCEIRQPVSQIELEEMLNENVRDSSSANNSLAGGHNNDSDNEQAATDVESKYNTLTEQPPVEEEQVDVVKSERAVTPPPSTGDTNPENSDALAPVRESPAAAAASVFFPSALGGALPMVRCHACGESKQLNLSVCRIHVAPSYEQMRTGVPYYPSVPAEERGDEDSQEQPRSVAFVCMQCLPKYQPHWHPLQKDFLKQFDRLAPPVLPRIPLPEQVTCYLCEQVLDTKHNDHLVSLDDDQQHVSSYLEARTMTPLAAPVKFGFTYLCSPCRAQVDKECPKPPASLTKTED